MMNREIKVGDKIKFKSSGLKYEVIKVFEGGFYDLRGLQPVFQWMPKYLPVFYSVRLEEYELLKQ